MADIPLVLNLNEALIYKGGAIPIGWNYSYAEGQHCVAEDGLSLFVVAGESISQISLQPVVNSTNAGDFPRMNQVLQQSSLRGFDPGLTQRQRFRIGGIVEINGELIIHYLDWYDNSSNGNNTMVFRDSSDIANCQIDGPFQQHGRDKVVGPISKLPPEYHSLFGGEAVGTTMLASIAGRLSLGPSAGGFYASELVGSGFIAGSIDEYGDERLPNYYGQHVFSYPINANCLYDEAKFPTSVVSASDRYNAIVVVNEYLADGNGDRIPNELWTIASQVAVAFVVPGTRTYICMGLLMGGDPTPRFVPNDNVPAQLDGLDYKGNQWKFVDGAYIYGAANDGGYGPLIREDYEPWYWLYDLDDVQKVRDGGIAPSSDIRPYKWGKLNIPDITGIRKGYMPYHPNYGSYDIATNTLRIMNEDRASNGSYSLYPVMLEFELDLDVLIDGTYVAPEPVEPPPGPSTYNLEYSQVAGAPVILGVNGKFVANEVDNLVFSVTNVDVDTGARSPSATRRIYVRDPNTVTYEWRQIAGPDAFFDITSPTLDFETTTTEGVYTFSVKVNDGYVTSEASTVTITVEDLVVAPEAPVVEVTGSAQEPAGTLVELTAGVTDVNLEDTHTYLWTVDRADVVLVNATSPVVSFRTPVGASPSNVVLRLVVNDGTFSSAPATHIVNILAATNLLPISLIGIPDGEYELLLLKLSDETVSKVTARFLNGSTNVPMADTTGSLYITLEINDSPPNGGADYGAVV